jgi:uncharacterized glyoxalase superfamily protein PhnB
MASESPLCDAPEAPEATPRASAGRRLPFAHRALRAARVRAVARLDRLTQRRRASSAGVMPTVRYRDVPAAIAWLCTALGMQVHRTVAGENGAPRYAELEFGGNLLMIAPIEDTPFGKLMVQPDEIGGVETQVCYLHVDDVAVHYARAAAAGAEIVLDIEDEANSGRGYSCRDPEGHLWNFGTYHPWRHPGAETGGAGRTRSSAARRRERTGLSVLMAFLIAALIAADPARPLPEALAGTAHTGTLTQEAAAADRPGREEADRAAGKPPDKEQPEPQAHLERTTLAAAEKIAAEARNELAEARAALKKAEREAAQARTQAEETRHARLAAEQAADRTRASLAAARKDAEEARAEAALERSRRAAAEQARGRRTHRRVTAYRAGRPRPRVWCYSPYGPAPSTSRRGGKLVGFCKG